MKIVSLRTFAQEIGVSLTAVQKGIRTGRIEGCQWNEKGHCTGIDLDSERVKWALNSKDNCIPKVISGGRPRKDGQAPAKPQTTGGQPDREAKAPDEKKGTSLADVQKARELTKLKLDQLKLKKEEGELVSAAEVEKNGYAIASMVIQGLYNIPDRIADELAGMSDPNEIHQLILSEIDSAVQQLREKYGR